MIHFRFSPSLSLREAGERPLLTGTAVSYGEVADIGNGFTESIAPGAFGLSGDSKVLFLAQHERSRILARSPGAGLVLRDSREALSVAASLPSTREAEDTATLVREGVFGGLSVGFLPQRVSRRAKHLTVEKARLVEISVVDVPAYGGSEVAMRRRDALCELAGDPRNAGEHGYGLWQKDRKLWL